MGSRRSPPVSDISGSLDLPRCKVAQAIEQRHITVAGLVHLVLVWSQLPVTLTTFPVRLMSAEAFSSRCSDHVTLYLLAQLCRKIMVFIPPETCNPKMIIHQAIICSLLLLAISN